MTGSTARSARLQADQFELCQLAVLFAAMISGFRHPGLDNSWQVETQSELALLYNDASPLQVTGRPTAAITTQCTMCHAVASLCSATFRMSTVPRMLVL